MKLGCCLSTPGSPEYRLHIAHSTSVTPESPYTHHCSVMIYLVAVIDRVWRCTGRLCSTEFEDAFEGRDGVNSEMHLEAEMK